MSLFQHLHEGLLITDPDLRVLDANPAYSQILGVPRDESDGVLAYLFEHMANPLFQCRFRWRANSVERVWARCTPGTLRCYGETGALTQILPQVRLTKEQVDHPEKSVDHQH